MTDIISVLMLPNYSKIKLGGRNEEENKISIADGAVAVVVVTIEIGFFQASSS